MLLVGFAIPTMAKKTFELICKMKKILLIYALFLYSCANYPSSENQICGRYNSMSDHKEDYYFFFYKNNTFNEVYISKGDTLKKIKGSWKFLDNKGTLELSHWFEVEDNGDLLYSPKGGSILLSKTLFH